MEGFKVDRPIVMDNTQCFKVEANATNTTNTVVEVTKSRVGRAGREACINMIPRYLSKVSLQ